MFSEEIDMFLLFIREVNRRQLRLSPVYWRSLFSEDSDMFLMFIREVKAVTCFSPCRLYSSEEEFMKVTDKIKRGDIIGCTGHPGRKKINTVPLLELSLLD